MLKKCSKGHQFNKTSSCPVCPRCEQEKEVFFIHKLSAPARRALENSDIDSLEKLSNYTEKEVLNLHGIGKTAIPILNKVLEEKGLSFKSNK
ncbi:MAG: hypothetical protein V4622_12900 [Bacteroidota bacterium]